MAALEEEPGSRPGRDKFRPVCTCAASGWRVLLDGAATSRKDAGVKPALQVAGVLESSGSALWVEASAGSCSTASRRTGAAAGMRAGGGVGVR